MVKPPELDTMIYETEVQERYETRHLNEDMLFKQESSLSELSRARIKAHVPIPEFLRKGAYSCIAIKKFTAESPLVFMKMQDQFKRLSQNLNSSYFVEIQDQAFNITDDIQSDPTMQSLNENFSKIHHNKHSENKILVLQLGNSAPGMNNIIDGLLKFQHIRRNTTLLGFVNGTDGL